MSVIDESTIKYIVIHCSATGPDKDYTAEDINEWHKRRDWSEIGYHFVIRRNGNIEIGRDLDETGAHVKGFNRGSWGVCLIGGLSSGGNPDANFTPDQWKSLRRTVKFLKLIAPNAEVLGHRDFPDVHKDCPCFNVREWYKGI